MQFPALKSIAVVLGLMASVAHALPVTGTLTADTTMACTSARAMAAA
jgi:hypothetical protein